MKPITDKAEVSIDFPEKAYMGSFGKSSRFEVQADAEEMLLKMMHSGEQRREVAMHLHYYLLADILSEFARALKAMAPLDEAHRDALDNAAQALAAALQKKKAPKKKGKT